jgi:hypothetical protein
MKNLRVMAVAVCLPLLSACATGVDQPAAFEVSGHTFDVTAVDGQSLPVNVAAMGRGSCYQASVGRATLAFLVDGTFDFRYWSVASDTTGGVLLETSWTQNANGAVLLSSGGSAGSGTLRGDTLTVDLAPTPFCDHHSLLAVVGS